ncbi:MAG: ribosome biogenesis GTPase YlqF [Defluviitaleaceae bacterium]|nr:ribosome biogenesis GTPase YlqF [Defluviitaleaceae bacterium]
MKNIHWYPGHMAKSTRAIEKDLKLVDLIIELLDARIPFASKNLALDEITNKPRIILLNKADMADDIETKKWQHYFEQQGKPVVLVNSLKGEGFSKITQAAANLMKDRNARLKARGRIFTPTRAMIVGIPNVGKSTLINKYVKKSIAKTANKPGVTRHNQWIKINKEFELLDTPGILPTKLDEKSGQRLAISGAVIDHVLDIYELSIILIPFLQERYCGVLKSRYDIEENLSPEHTLNAIAESKKLLQKGATLDITRAANLLIDDFRNLRLNRITLETPEDIEKEREEIENNSKV